VFVKINGETHYLWRAVDHGRPGTIVTDRLRSYSAAMTAIGIVARQECGRWLKERGQWRNLGT
jgi:putative transposase